MSKFHKRIHFIVFVIFLYVPNIAVCGTDIFNSVYVPPCCGCASPLLGSKCSEPKPEADSRLVIQRQQTTPYTRRRRVDTNFAGHEGMLSPEERPEPLSGAVPFLTAENEEKRKVPVLSSGDLIVFGSKSLFGRFAINVTSQYEDIEMGHVAMVVHVNNSDKPSPMDIHLLTAEEDGASVKSLSDIMENYQRDYRSAWVISMTQPVTDIDKLMSESSFQDENTDSYNWQGILAGFVKLTIQLPVPLPKRCESGGTSVFCSQAIVEVLKAVSLLRSDLKSYEIATAYMPYLLSRARNDYLFSNNAKHLWCYFPEHYFPGYTGRSAGLSRSGSEQEILEKTLHANTRAESFVDLISWSGLRADGRYPEIIQKLASFPRKRSSSLHSSPPFHPVDRRLPGTPALRLKRDNVTDELPETIKVNNKRVPQRENSFRGQ